MSRTSLAYRLGSGISATLGPRYCRRHPTPEVAMTQDAKAVRARLDAEVDGLTVPKQFQQTVAEHGDVVALKWKEGDGWGQMTYREYGERVRLTALGMRELFGLQRG